MEQRQRRSEGSRPKALLVATVSGFVPQFQMNNVTILQELGFEVHYASNFNLVMYGNDNRRLRDCGIVLHQIDFSKNLLSSNSITVYKQLCELMLEHQFDLMHCHTPIAGALARGAAGKAHVPVVIYTAHGLHVYEGAPVKNWLLYGNAERFFARFTDLLITINHEDYELVSHFHFKPGGKAVLVPGVGIDLSQYQRETEKETNNNGKIVLLSVGELNTNKNHQVVIEALSKTKNRDFIYYICGQGNKEKELRSMIELLGLNQKVKLLGYCDPQPYYESADIFVMPSFREGLPRAIMEAMAYSLPVACSKIRGNVDLVDECVGGLYFNPYSLPETIAVLEKLMDDAKLRKRFGEHNLERVKCYDIENINELMFDLYKSVL